MPAMHVDSRAMALPNTADAGEVEYRWRSDNARHDLRWSFEGEDLVVTKARRSRRLPLKDVTGFFVRNEVGGPRLYVSWKASGRANTMRERCEQGDELSRFLDALAARTPKGADLRGTATEAAPAALRVGGPASLWLAAVIVALIIAVGAYLATR